jgi:hypothetical protein
MTALSSGVQNALLTPDEARGLENRPAKGGNADKLFIQGATIPIDQEPEPEPEPVDDGTAEEIEALGERMAQHTEALTERLAKQSDDIAALAANVAKRQAVRRVPVRDPVSGLITSIEEIEA